MICSEIVPIVHVTRVPTRVYFFSSTHVGIVLINYSRANPQPPNAVCIFAPHKDAAAVGTQTKKAWLLDSNDIVVASA